MVDLSTITADELVQMVLDYDDLGITREGDAALSGAN